MKFLLRLIFLFYQKLISPALHVFFGAGQGACKFYPSCSEYSIQAVEKYGIVKGLLKSLTRILRCRPGTQGGVDLP